MVEATRYLFQWVTVGRCSISVLFWARDMIWNIYLEYIEDNPSDEQVVGRVFWRERKQEGQVNSPVLMQTY